ncbi:hypothetical protein [Nocardioides panacisoli]|uniref:Uncharacterized protein n=1 Tax=Nocardioides panacisoli TaxID=627624 RepID=A0ABP7IHB3_9ACTN
MAPGVHSIRATCAALLLVAGLGAALGTSSSAATATPDCPAIAGLTPNVWVGGTSDLWHDDDNWSLGFAPGVSEGGLGYACIPSDDVRLEGPADVRNVQALHLGKGASLVLNDESQLFVRGNPGNMTSTIDHGAVLSVEGSTFGGEGEVKLAGTLVWHSNSDGPMATFATRPCSVVAADPDTTARTAPCNGPAGGHLDRPGGLLVVKPAGTLEVDGAGVALTDGYRIRDQGVVDVSGAGYVVADYGTTTEVAENGEFRFENDGGYYEGEARFGQTQLSKFLNEGLLLKKAGDGVSAVNAIYPQLGGEIRIESGTLRVASGTPVAARVAAGASYGSGECRHVGGTFGCRPRTDTVDKQNAALRVPLVDHDGADVTVSELDKDPTLYSIGAAVEVHADELDATKRHPAILTFRYDDSLLLPGASWRYLHIWRNSDGPGGYRKVHACDENGRPPVGEQACVDRRGIAGVSSRDKAGDVIMVVRATGTSRWIAR